MGLQEIDLTERHDQFIDQLIDAGSFADASEVVTAGLRLLAQRDAEDRARIEGLRSGATLSDSR